MKFIVLLAVILGAGMLLGTRKDTPFIRWGVIVALAGVLLSFTSAIFAVRSVLFGTVIAVIGVCVYAWGRFARKEQIFVSRR